MSLMANDRVQQDRVSAEIDVSLVFPTTGKDSQILRNSLEIISSS